MVRPLTQQQRKVLGFVEEHRRRRGFAPSLREIADGLGLANVSAVHGHLAALEKKGYIARDPDKARSIRVVRSPSPLSRLKRALHGIARTNQGVLHRVVYGLVLACRKRRPHFAGRGAEWIRQAFDRQCLEHGWKVLDLRIEPDHVRVVLEVWPNHSPQQTAQRLRATGEAVRRAHRAELPGRRLWAGGYVATTDVAVLEDLAGQFLRQVPAERGREPDGPAGAAGPVGQRGEGPEGR